MMMSTLYRLAWAIVFLLGARAFHVSPRNTFRRSPRLFASADVDTKTLEEIRSMRVKEIKAELSEMKVSSNDVFEKEELVQRLFDARQKQPATSSPSTTTSASTASSGDVPPSAIRAPLYFTSMEAGKQIAALNDNAGLTINPSQQPYATIQMDVVNPSGPDFSLSLLLDTACSGLVLRPSVVKQYNLPSYSNPVTMTGAGGTTTGATGLTQISKVMFGGDSFGPMPAAVQDIGALPSSLDGIIGLSFLSQFACVEFDFRAGALTLYKSERRPPVPDNLEVVAEAEMSLVKLGIWYCDVWLDNRGPVKMLVDSGAANTFLNWKGVSDMSLSRDSPLVKPIPNMGAMGSDNVAMRLTHRIMVEQNLNLGQRPSHSGLSMISGTGLGVDIGDIAVLDTLKGDNVGGILGIDVMMQCALVRMTFNGPIPRITLMN